MPQFTRKEQDRRKILKSLTKAIAELHEVKIAAGRLKLPETEKRLDECIQSLEKEYQDLKEILKEE